MINKSQLLSNTFVLKTILSYVDEIAVTVNICTLDSTTMKPCRYEFKGNRMEVSNVSFKTIQGALANAEIEDYYFYENEEKRVFRVNTKRQYQLL